MSSDEQRWLDALRSEIVEERAVAALQLAPAPSPHAVASLRAAANDSQPIVAFAAQYALWQSGYDEIDVAAMVRACVTGDEALHQQVAMLGEQIGAPLVPRLAPLLHDSGATAQVVLQLLDDIHDPTAHACVQDWQPTAAVLVEARARILREWHDDD